MKSWKMRREARRIAQHAEGVVIAPFEAAARWRRRKSQVLSEFGNELPICRKIAIYVLYQPAGVAESTFASIRYLARCGYETIVVSNAPLAAEERQRLTSVACNVVERPNFGYDFGAYREAILSLSDRLETLEALLLMNDSVWFPLFTGADPLREMEAMPLDICAAQAFGERLISRKSSKRGHPILGSYFLLFRNTALTHAAFERFWKEYRMSSNKEITMRRGERELSRRLFASGLACGAHLNDYRFEDVVNRLPADRMKRAVEEMVCLSRRHAERRHRLLSGGYANTDEMRELILEVSETKNMIGSSPLLCLEYLRSAAFVKKNDEMLYRLARQRIAKAILEGRLQGVDPVMAAELQASAEVDSGNADLRKAEAA